MKIFKLLRVANSTKLFFSPQNHFHVGYLKQFQMKQLSNNISFAIRQKKKQENQEFDNICGSKQESVVENSIAQEILYEPKERLIFNDNICKIYENDGYYSARAVLFIITLFLGFLIYKFSKRFHMHYSNGKWFRCFFYVFLIYL